MGTGVRTEGNDDVYRKSTSGGLGNIGVYSQEKGAGTDRGIVDLGAGEAEKSLLWEGLGHQRASASSVFWPEGDRKRL